MNLKYCFTALVAAHLISILSELKILSILLSFGSYAGAKTRSPLVICSYQLHSVQGRAQCPTDAASVPQHRELVTGTRAPGQGPKYCNPPG